MSPLANTAPARIRLLALPETTPTSIYGLHEVFSAVGVAWQEMTGETVDVRRLDARIVAKDSSPFPSPLGTPIVPHERLEDVERADAVIVTDLALTADNPHGRWAVEAAWARGQFENGAIVCSVCTGSIFLAEAGLLDSIEATTHWGAAGLVAKWYPRVRLRPERILCPAGPEHRIVTGGGAGAWTDLALYLIARFSGSAEAVRIAKLFVLGDRADGQLPFAAIGRPQRHEDAAIARCQQWLAEHYTERGAVARMLALSGLPERTFKRRFKVATGYAPTEYVQAIRIEEAKQLLETTGAPTDAVAHMVGYDDPAFFRRLFKRLTSITPARYRRRFQSITGLNEGHSSQLAKQTR